MKQLTSIISLLAVIATILIGGATVGATVQGNQSGEPPRGLRRMLQTLDAPNVAKMEVTSAAQQISHERIP